MTRFRTGECCYPVLLVAAALSLCAPLFSIVGSAVAYPAPPLERVGFVSHIRRYRPTQRSPVRRPLSPSLSERHVASYARMGEDDTTFTLSSVSRKFYEHDGYTLSYLHKRASPGYELSPPLVLVHPVGIGLSSWFWNKFLEEWVGAEVFAPDLIGCGLENGSCPPWIPDVKGMSFPLGWVNALEKLIHTEVANPEPRVGGLLGGLFPRSNTPRSCVVVAQGGMTPVGVLLASRNPTAMANDGGGGVSHLVLTSSQTWEDMVVPVPEPEMARNYDFLKSPVLGKMAFYFLESRWAVRFFSNAFLFLETCDEEWVDRCTRTDAIRPEARAPIMAFNSGFLNHRSYEEELRTLEQPTLVLSGTGDKRVENRVKYGELMHRCELRSIPGTNVLPWESPGYVCAAIQTFLEENDI